jgi:hypothetical protein
MGLDTEVFKAIDHVIAKAKLGAAKPSASAAAAATPATTTTAVAASSAATAVSDMRNYVEHEEAEMDAVPAQMQSMDWSMIAIQTGMGMMTVLRKTREAEQKRRAEMADARGDDDEARRADPTYAEDAQGRELVGNPTMLPFVRKVIENLSAFLNANRSIHTFVLCADKFWPRAKQRTRQKRRESNEIKPYSARHYRIDISTGHVVHRATGKRETSVDYKRVVMNRTSLMSQLIRCLICQLQRGEVGGWPLRGLPPNVRFIFDFSDTHQDHVTWRRYVQPVALQLRTDENGRPGIVEDAPEGPTPYGEADLSIVAWVARLGLPAIVLTGDGDLLAIMAAHVEALMRKAMAEGRLKATTADDEKSDAAGSSSDAAIWSLKHMRAAGLPALYLLKNRTAGYQLEHEKTSMYNFNYAMVLLHRHQWSADKLALLAILATNDFFIDDDKAVLLPRIGVQKICDVISGMTTKQVRQAMRFDAQFKLMVLWMWLADHGIAKKKKANAKKDPPPKSFKHIQEILTRVDDFDKGYAMLTKDTKTAPTARQKMDVMLDSRVMRHFRRLVLANKQYWAFEQPDDDPEKLFDTDPAEFSFTRHEDEEAAPAAAAAAATEAVAME